MNTRAFSCMLLFALALSIAACAPSPTVPSPTHSKPPTARSVPTPIAISSPTLPSEPKIVDEITLHSLPGLGRRPQAIAVLNDRIYVANHSSDNVSVIEGSVVVEVISVGDAPVAAVADPDTGLVYIANERDDSISIISGDQVVTTVPAPEDPSCLAILDGRLYAGGRGHNAISVLDAATGAAIGSVPLKGRIGILALAANPATRLLYASVYDSVQIVDLDSLTVEAQLVDDGYVTLGADPIAGGFFVSDYDAGTNTHYLVKYAAFAQKELGRTPIGGDPRGMAVDPQTGHIYVANSWSNDVSVIDVHTLRLLATVPVGLHPVDVAVGEDGEIYVANADSDSVAVIDGESNRLSRVVPVSIIPRGMAVHPDTGRLYVACASTNSVFVIEGMQVVDEVHVGLHPIDVALTADGSGLFVLNHVSGDLMLVSTHDNRVVETVQIGRLPQGLAMVPDTGQLYVSDAVLDAEELRLLRRAELRSIYDTLVKPIDIQVDAEAGRAYTVASNDVPGSNGGLVVYMIDLMTGERIQGSVGGLSMTGLALDSEGERIFSTIGRFGYHQLIVNDLRSYEQTTTLDLLGYPAALAYNPETYHLFICLTPSSNPAIGPGAEIRILDSRGLGTVAQIPLPDEPEVIGGYELAVDTSRGYIYIADARRGTVHVLRDVPLPPPPSPTPADTPTPRSTATPHPLPSPTAAVVTELSCQHALGAPFEPLWSDDTALRIRLGCPVDEAQSGFMAEQPFQQGRMLWREADRSVFVLYNHGTWNSYVDLWHEGLAEYGCEGFPPGNLLQPKRGLGLVWCEEDAVKGGLGWATDEEQGIAHVWQLFEHGQMISGGTRPIIYALSQDGTFVEYPAT
ncbi:MAG TPA: beta-propeller fold lactonase family protein [Anaerolineae bacterium]|nr:beta-propeller fold lactonase family protein [Anaerolineae bacterium]